MDRLIIHYVLQVTVLLDGLYPKVQMYQSKLVEFRLVYSSLFRTKMSKMTNDRLVA